MFTLFFHFSLSIPGNTILSWTSSDMTSMFLSHSRAEQINRKMGDTKGKLRYLRIPKSLKKFTLKTSKSLQMHQLPSVKCFTPQMEFLGWERTRDQGPDHISARWPDHQDISYLLSLYKRSEVWFYSDVEKKCSWNAKVPSLLHFASATKHANRRQDTTTRLVTGNLHLIVA